MSCTSLPSSPLTVITDADYQQIVRLSLARLQHPQEPSAIDSRAKFTLRGTAEHCSGLGGYMGDYYRIAVDVLDGCQAVYGEQVDHTFRYFVKAPPTHDAKLLEVMRLTGMATRESHIFATVLPQLDVRPFPHNWSPACVFNRSQLLIFDDLTPQLYAHLPECDFFDEAHLRQSLRSLGRMHASSLRFELQTGQTIPTAFGAAFFAEPTFVLTNTRYVAGMKAAVAIAADHCSRKPEKRWAQRFNADQMLERLFEVRRLLDPADPETVARGYRSVFAHRDLWCNNVMFKYRSEAALAERRDPTHAVLIDYQMCQYLPPAADVAQLLYLNTRRGQRCNETEYLREYHTALAEELSAAGYAVETVLPWQELVESYEVFRLFGLACAVHYGPMTRQPDDAYNAMRLADPLRFQRLNNVRRDDFILDLMAKDKLFDEVIRESVEELLEVLFAGGVAAE